MAGQTINDRFLAARHSIAGQGLAKAVCKATTEEMIGPKRKHLDYLIHCTNEPNISIPQMATLLVERSQHANWVVVYKALITTHHLMCYGNERFTQFMASSNSTFQLSMFLDKSGVQGVLSGRAGYDMSPFIRRYARYLNEKAISYRTVAFDFCKVKRGKDDGTLRTMGTDRLLKTLPALQAQLDALLDFDCSANELTNSVINVCFMLLFRDLIRLFACYNDAIINLLEKFFDMNKKQCREALDLYKKFLIRMDRVSEFLKVAENMGIDKGDIPDLTKAPSSLLEALEQHLLSIEGKKNSISNGSGQAATNAKNVKSAVTMLSSTSTSFGTAATNSEAEGFGQSVIDDALRQRALAEEEAVLNQYKAKVQSPSSGSIASNNNLNNPFLSTPTSEKISNPQSTSFGSSDSLFSTNTPSSTTTNKASHDLLQLNNPFADAFDTQPKADASLQGNNMLFQSNVWMSNGYISPIIQQQTSNNNSLSEFVPDSAFSSVFGNNGTTIQSRYSFFVQAASENNCGLTTNPFIFNTESNLNYDNTEPIFQNIVIPSHTSDNECTQSNSFTEDANKSDKEIDSLSEMDNKEINESDNIKTVPNETILEPLRPALVKLSKPPRPPLPNKRLPHNVSPSRKIENEENSPNENIEVNQTNDPIVHDLLGEFDNNLTDVKHNCQLPFQSPTPLVGFICDANDRYIHPSTSNLSISQQIIGSNITEFDSIGNNTTTLSNTTSPTNNTTPGAGILTGDLETSLASLAENLSINNRPIPPKSVQWNSPKHSGKVGANWSPQPMAATNGSGYKPMGQGMATTPLSTLTPSPYQPQLNIQGIRPISTMGMVQPLGVNVSVYPQLANLPSTTLQTSPQMQAQQTSLLFH